MYLKTRAGGEGPEGYLKARLRRVGPRRGYHLHARRRLGASVEVFIVPMTSHLKLMLALLFVLAASLPGPALAQQQPANDDRPSLDGITLQRTEAGRVAVYYDPDIEPAVVSIVGDAIQFGLAAVPTVSELPPFTTPIILYLLRDEDRFRLALAEIGGVRIDLVSEDIGGYTIERDGTMLVFFEVANVTSPPNAVLAVAHELAHLGVREATHRRTVPQWFNEGYASWVSTKVLERLYPEQARLQVTLDRLAVASALRTRGLVPWPELVTRTRFSKAGVEGLVSLAYAQSTRFVDWLDDRYTTAALARFLTGIGDGLSPTQSFGAAFGPFGPESAAYEASLNAHLPEFQPGLYVVQRATADQPTIVAVIGGEPSDTAVVEVWQNGERIRRREIDLDGAGMLVGTIPAGLLDEGGPLRVRARVPGLGTLELDPATDTRAVAPPAAAPAPPSPGQPAQGPAPAQLPHQSWLLPAWPFRPAA
jgi:hypothetical protein